ncbi:hypothetical protein C8R41DRAFT_805660 [Lentinula lateritia]|uniref:Uncharacterized protein n=1 Tax=Lentinula lateritia TaxID=40482 RepID=A0ABQ8W085_9AGAR|nr:hypothetical protein C8R41DRAFT_805660 [Lentinula lateritia]
MRSSVVPRWISSTCMQYSICFLHCAFHHWLSLAVAVPPSIYLVHLPAMTPLHLSMISSTPRLHTLKISRLMNLPVLLDSPLHYSKTLQLAEQSSCTFRSPYSDIDSSAF